MRILVCVKQVPDIDQVDVTRSKDGFACLAPFSEYRMNRYDEFAVEAALRIEAGGAAPVGIDVVTVGPQRAEEVLRRALGMGAHEGIHLQSLEDQYLGPGTVAAGIARYAGLKDYDLALCGCMSEDGMHGQVGPRLAGHLKWPCAVQAVRLQLNETADAVTVEKETEGGGRERLRLNLPAVIAVQSGINRPRYPALSKLLRANARALETIPLTEIAPPPVESRFVGAILPEPVRAGRVLAGTLTEKAAALLALLKEKALISGAA
ncbi:MAG: electron transfer flavoprotein subunit beta/FixA family protein [Desulfosarcinaceae bacterium]